MYTKTGPARTDLSDRWLFSLALVATVLLLMAPRMTHAMHLMLAAVPLAALWQHGERPQPWPLPGLALAAGVLGLYIIANAGWAVDPREAYGKVAYYWLLAITVTIAFQGFARVGDPRLERVALGIVAGIALAAAILAIELVLGQPMRRALYTLAPVLRGPVKNLEISPSGAVLGINALTLNRSVAVLCLMLWPAVLMMQTTLKRQQRLAAGAGLVLVSGLAILASEHETSMLALLASLLVLAGMLVAAPVMRGLVLVGWLCATLLVVPIAVAAYSGGLHTAKWIPETGRNRIILWGVTASEMRKAPILGVGVGSTKDLDEQTGANAPKPADHSYPLRTGRHAHNVFMQTWYELGAVGALLLSALGIAAWMALGRLPAATQPYVFASFVAAVVIGAFSWGMWQTWFMAAYGIWALALGAGIELSRRRAGQE